MKRRIMFALVIVLIVGAIWYLESMKASPFGPGGPGGAGSPINVPTATSTGTASVHSALAAIASADQESGYKPAVEIVDPTGFVNASDTFTLSSLVGKKVILLDFWTYSCINCIRAIPHLNDWYKKYAGEGLVIVGVHTPEFEFEKDIGNVTAAVKKFGIQYPVVLDGNYGTWHAYGNLYWPHEYLIDAAGYVVHDLIGEGDYDGTERAIQSALAARAQALGEAAPPPQAITSPNEDILAPGSPETYFGSSRNEFLGNGAPGRVGIQSFTESITVLPNTLYLIGTWNIAPEYAETPSSVGSPQTGSDRIDYRYRAKGVYIVAGSSSGAPVDVEVLRDSKPVDASVAGADVFYKDGKSYIRVKENRLYRIIDDASAGDHFLELIISSPGFQAFTFTFG